MRINSGLGGRRTSGIEVTHVSIHGFWLLVESQEVFVPFNEFPWFRDASISQLTNAELQSPHHLYWPQLDIDLAVESLEHPDRYPLISRVHPPKHLQPSTAQARERGPKYRGKPGSRRSTANHSVRRVRYA
ncbi:MAG TPA: DUF2442 domain-containing protein [Candidatus Methylomirabilis sp.]|nr:DUF2442 domain-containing protein [Candidatus Methylomirabilis sp.]